MPDLAESLVSLAKGHQALSEIVNVRNGVRQVGITKELRRFAAQHQA